MKKNDLGKKIYEVSCIKGKFHLRSGITSDEYFDKYLSEGNPDLLRSIAEHMVKLIPEKTDTLAGLEMGGIPIVTMLSQLTGLPSLFVRKKAKRYGTCKLAEGGNVEGRAVIVEDVVTSGGQIIESTNQLRLLGAKVKDVLCVIDREQGGRKNLKDNGLLFHPLFTMSELKGIAQQKGQPDSRGSAISGKRN